MQKKNFQFTATYDSITKQIDQEHNDFIAKTIGKVRTLDYVTILPNVPYSIEVGPLVSSNIDLTVGTCPAVANGATTSIASVNITTSLYSHYETFCLDDMKLYFNRQMGRGAIQEDLPFESQFLDEKNTVIAKKLDAKFFLGDGTVAGVIYGATAGGAVGLTAGDVSATPWSVSTAVSNGAINTIDKMIQALPADVLDADDLVLFVSRTAFDAYSMSIRNLVGVNWDTTILVNGVAPVWGKPNVTLVATAGLAGSNKAILHRSSLLFWATDLNAEGQFKGGYENTLGKYLLRYAVKLGAGIGFPDQAVICTIA